MRGRGGVWGCSVVVCAARCRLSEARWGRGRGAVPRVGDVQPPARGAADPRSGVLRPRAVVSTRACSENPARALRRRSSGRAALRRSGRAARCASRLHARENGGNQGSLRGLGPRTRAHSAAAAAGHRASARGVWCAIAKLERPHCGGPVAGQLSGQLACAVLLEWKRAPWGAGGAIARCGGGPSTLGTHGNARLTLVSFAGRARFVFVWCGCRMGRRSSLALQALVALVCLTVVSGQFFVNLNDKNKVLLSAPRGVQGSKTPRTGGEVQKSRRLRSAAGSRTFCERRHGHLSSSCCSRCNCTWQ